MNAKLSHVAHGSGAPAIAVLGAAGVQASALLEGLGRAVALDRVLAVDRAWPGAERARIDGLGAAVLTGDIAADADRLAERLAGCDLIVNMAGPFYALGTAPLELAIAAQTDYLDICDDGDATQALLALDERAREAGIRALIGMGSSPGMTNVLIRAALDALPDEEAEVEIAWTVDTEDISAAVLEHMFHCFGSALDGRGGTPPWEELGLESIDFPDPVGTQPVVRLGHPEPLTVPRFTRVGTIVNKGGIAPAAHLHFAWRLARLHDRLGAANGSGDDLYALYADLRAAGDGWTRTGSGLQIDVTVGGDGFRFASGADMSMEVATGTPAAAGSLLMLDDPALEPGVWAPECLEPRRVFEKLRLVSGGGGGLHAMRLAAGRTAGLIQIRDLIAGRT